MCNLLAPEPHRNFGKYDISYISIYYTVTTPEPLWFVATVLFTRDLFYLPTNRCPLNELRLHSLICGTVYPVNIADERAYIINLVR